MISPAFRVLVTDYGWPNLDVERSILEPLGCELVVADSVHESRLAELAQSCDAILACWAEIGRRVIESAPQCRLIVRLGVGLDNIDLEAARARGIPVCNVPDYCVDEVADHAMLVSLAFARRYSYLVDVVREGRWSQSPLVPWRLSGRTLGLVGFGRVAQAFARRAEAHGMKVTATSTRYPDRAGWPNVDFCDDIHELAAASDIVSLHVPLVDATRHLVDADFLSAMKNEALLVNTARGGLIDTEALVRALAEQRIGGAALDVTEPEPLPPSHPLLSFPNVTITPHSAFYSDGSAHELSAKAAAHVARLLLNQPMQNVVN